MLQYLLLQRESHDTPTHRGSQPNNCHKIVISIVISTDSLVLCLHHVRCRYIEHDCPRYHAYIIYRSSHATRCKRNISIKVYFFTPGNQIKFPAVSPWDVLYRATCMAQILVSLTFYCMINWYVSDKVSNKDRNSNRYRGNNTCCTNILIW